MGVSLGAPAAKGTTAAGLCARANAAAATDLVRRYVRMGTVMLLGSLAQPRKVRFEFERCVSVGTVMPDVASASGGGASGSGEGAVDALLLWDVFLGDALFERTVCDAVQLFASPDCSGSAAAEYQNTVYHTRDMSTVKMGASVKSILLLPYVPCTCSHTSLPCVPPIRPSHASVPCVRPMRPSPLYLCEQYGQDGRISEVHPTAAICALHLLPYVPPMRPSHAPLPCAPPPCVCVSSAFKMGASVKSIRCVLVMPLSPFFPPSLSSRSSPHASPPTPCLSPHSFFHASPPILSPILLPPCHFLPSHPSHPFLPCDPDDICSRI
ncbi:unnamed protein product, partial [Closterium sp. NIES-65]